MAILYQAPAGRPWRRVALVTAALITGVALAWLARPTGAPRASAGIAPAAAVARDTAPAAAAPAPTRGEADPGCDARCTVAKVIGPASAACTSAVEDLAGFGVRWLDRDAAPTRFDRVAWLDAARGTVTLGGARVEFRNASGAYRPVAYECDFNPATLAVLTARARPDAPPAVAAADR